MTLEQKVNEQADILRQCAGDGNCVGCPLFTYVGNCQEKLKRDSAELLEDQQAVIESLAAKVSEMTASIVKLMNKYAGAGYGKAQD